MAIRDSEAMDVIAKWMEDTDPTLDASLPNWVWRLTALLDDLITETGRRKDSEEV